MAGGWVYILTNKPYGTFYVGVTNDLRRRAQEHRDGAAEGFSKRYGLHRLVYVERHEDIRYAIVREKAIKSWLRKWKVDLIEAANPDWRNLFHDLNK